MRGQSVNLDEIYCEFFECTECHSTDIQEHFNFCPECGSPTEATKTVDV